MACNIKMENKTLTIVRDEPDFLEIHIWKGMGEAWPVVMIILAFGAIYMFYRAIIFFVSNSFSESMINIPILIICLVGLYWTNDHTSNPIIISLDAKNDTISRPSLFSRRKINYYKLSLLQSLKLSYFEKGGQLKEQMLINPQKELAINHLIFDFGNNNIFITIQTINHASVKEWYSLFVRLNEFFVNNNYKVYVPHI